MAGGGRIRVDNISSKSGSGSVYFNAGVDITGVGTVATLENTTLSSANVTVTGITTSGSTIVGSAVTTDSEGIRAAGIVTATSFTGDGANLTGLNIPAGFTWVEASLF